jgi:hypothetical protein
MKYQYIKLRLPYIDIYNIINDNQYKNIIFYIDLLSVSRGFYNKATAQTEINQYVQSKHEGNKDYKPSLYLTELRFFLNTLYNKFANYDPRFILFFDDGICKQNTDIDNDYKFGRRGSYSFIDDNDLRNLLKSIKKYYFEEINDTFHLQNLSYVVYTKEYESDVVPYYVISKNYLNSQHSSILNIVLSADKDLLQTCKYKNVIQCTSTYANKQIQINIYEDNDAIGYIYKNFKRGRLTSQHIPLILAIAGDKADQIEGVKGVGPAKAVSLITENNMSPSIDKNTKLPAKLENHRDLLINNFKLIDFQSQLTRMSNIALDRIDQLFKI